MKADRIYARAELVWQGLRALHEGDEPTPELLAKVSGKNARTIARRAAADGWRRGGGLVHERLRRVFEELLQRMEATLDRLRDEPHGNERAQFEAISLMTKIADKIGEFTRQDTGANEKKKTDAEKRAILKRIDTRIFELASEIARGMGPARPDP